MFGVSKKVEAEMYKEYKRRIRRTVALIFLGIIIF